MAKYTSEKNALILISLLKQYGIRKIIVSPGAMNVSFVGSIQSDDYFQIYSCVDERSACYMACGLAEESGEPVALSCTGATASRNYFPGLTEAYYRKLPILAITSAQFRGNVGHGIPQIIDRTVQPNDLVKFSAQIPTINSKDDEWYCTIEINKALLALTHEGGGPVHINLVTEYSTDFDITELPIARKINRITSNSVFPEIPSNSKVGIFVGNHSKWSKQLTSAVESFCEKHNGVVLCDRTSNYFGKYKVFPNLICDQDNYSSKNNDFDLLIHIGNISGAYMKLNAKNVWRVNPDGKIVDTFKCLTNVFQMEEYDFFHHYQNNTNKKNTSFSQDWQKEFYDLQTKTVSCELPFSNIWIAREIHNKLPTESILHLGILNSLRSWNYFDNQNTVYGYSNTGGFGIDGITSTIIGASLANPKKNIYGVIGDLAFFYDLNALGNRYIGNNIRLLLVNNGCGTEFHNYSHAAQVFGDKVSNYIAANGHFGNQSINLVKQFSETLGFEYISASNIEEFKKYEDYFVSDKIYTKPVIFEIFTNSESESQALKTIRSLETSIKTKLKNDIKKNAKQIIGSSAKQKLKKIIGR